MRGPDPREACKVSCVRGSQPEQGAWNGLLPSHANQVDHAAACGSSFLCQNRGVRNTRKECKVLRLLQLLDLLLVGLYERRVA